MDYLASVGFFGRPPEAFKMTKFQLDVIISGFVPSYGGQVPEGAMEGMAM